MNNNFGLILKTMLISGIFIISLQAKEGMRIVGSDSVATTNNEVKQQQSQSTSTSKGVALKDSNCTSSFSIESQKVILPVGYFKDYIKKSISVLPHYIGFEFDSANVDTGYIYCIGTQKNGKFSCIDNLNKIVKSKDINFVKVDGKSKTYFLFDKKDSKLKFKLPLIKKYYCPKTKSVTLSLLQHQEKSNKEACLAQDKKLKLNLEPFKVGYSISQTLAQNESRVKEYKSNVTISNPQGVNIKLFDLYSKNKVSTNENTKSMDMKVYDNKLSGFCLKFDMGFSGLHLKEGYDYFCKTTTFGNFNFAVFDDALNSVAIKNRTKEFIQVGAIRLVDAVKGELPFEMLGIERSSRLIRMGYKDLKTSYIGDMIYILVGPFKSKNAQDELSKVQTVVSDALIYDEALIRCQNKPHGCRK